jgi:hypothetical protein
LQLNGEMAHRRHPRGGLRSKTISVQGITGQKGVNLIESVVLKMGSRWTVSGPNEVGIDGYIELFDPATRESLGLTLAVQSKVVSSIRDQDEDFRYSCARNDLEYWLKGNIPVILIVSAPDTNQAYWVWIQEAFDGWKPGDPTSVLFRRSRSRFDASVLAELVRIGAPVRGLYVAPRPKPERLWSNLLTVETLPDVVFIGATEFFVRDQVREALGKKKSQSKSGWVVWEKKIISFEDLSTDQWNGVVEPGTVEGFDTVEWSESPDADRRRLFVQLLNSTLREELADRVRFWPEDDCFAMAGPERKQSYRSLKKNSGLSVVSKFASRSKDGRTFHHWRHLAFRGKFRCLENSWFLEITPTYRFTYNGYDKDRFHESRLKKIKEIEGNRAVLSGVLFWAEFLKPKEDLFSEVIPLIGFGTLATFEIPVGIEDKGWQKNDPDAEAQEQRDHSQGVFDLTPLMEGEQ